MKNKKIYITSLHMRHGGVEMVISSLANALVRRGFEVEILCTYDFGTVAYPLDSAVKITYLTNVLPNKEAFKAAYSSGKVFAALREGFRALKIIRLKKKTMAKALSQITDGAVISTRNEHSVLLSKYGRPGVLKIAQLHHDHRYDKALLRDFARKYSNIDYFVLLTPKLAEEVREIMKDNTHTKVLSIPNFVAAEDIAVGEPEKQVIAAGRLHPDKDFHSLLRIWRSVHEKHPDYMLKICGEGNLKDELTEYARQLDIDSSVTFAGAVPHGKLLSEMSRSVCYVMTSVTEGFPMVLLEALYTGTPSVAFDVRVGLDSLIEDGKTGYIVKDRDEDAFSDKICQLIENPELRDSMSKSSAERASDFSEENIMKKWLELIDGKTE